MRLAAQYLLGVHNFAAYGKAGDATLSTVRKVEDISIRRLTEGRILIMVSATGFLRSMVRNIVGMLLGVGKGNALPDTALTILQSANRTSNPYSPAAPQGLFLWRVKY